MLNAIIFPIAVLLATAVLSFVSNAEKVKKIFACGGVILGSAIGLIPSLLVLRGGARVQTHLLGFQATLPELSLSIGLDPLSAFFLIAIFGLSGITGVYAWGYVRDQPRLLSTLHFFPLLVAAMAAVVIVRNAFWFLVFWEIMSLTSFFLVTTEHESREARRAGWITLIATHLATTFLMIFFILLFKETGSFAFDDFVHLDRISVSLAGLLFVCAVIGFGTKAGFFPLHVWLPHAHPAAPSHISALMSGVMIKTGIYGILRTLTFFQSVPLWWGGVLMLLGILSCVLGVLYALMQHDLKRLLAYHSVENIGIIAVGIGLGLMGLAEGNTAIACLGFMGALFHVWNHAVFKGLLFLGAGSILHATHTRRIDALGSLFKKMRITGITFLIASAAICGLPPFNGFISEWLIYVGLFNGSQFFAGSSLFTCIAAIVAIALAGGLAIACFTKVFGVVFLGEPRSENAASAHEVSWAQQLPMILLACLCILLGIVPQWAISLFASVLPTLHSMMTIASMSSVLDSLNTMSFIFLGVFISAGLLFVVIQKKILRQSSRKAPTWDCGYVQPTPRMQYSASSFAEPIATFFHFLIRPITHFRGLAGLFPTASHFKEHVMDWSEQRLFLPLIGMGLKILTWIRHQQKSRVQDYLAYMFLTLILLFLWEVWIGF